MKTYHVIYRNPDGSVANDVYIEGDLGGTIELAKADLSKIGNPTAIELWEFVKEVSLSS